VSLGTVLRRITCGFAIAASQRQHLCPEGQQTDAESAWYRGVYFFMPRLAKRYSRSFKSCSYGIKSVLKRSLIIDLANHLIVLVIIKAN
jgi:hypothetical protein